MTDGNDSADYVDRQAEVRGYVEPGELHSHECFPQIDIGVLTVEAFSEYTRTGDTGRHAQFDRLAITLGREHRPSRTTSEGVMS